ncbi:ABC transporter ATP-binding protein [Desulfovibrio gilichinskyi]|uniref:Lipopolysaccharide transport system ATP-binding protein n=1 Tax=Desulfovibrio gilichinskyi TaxID=1519643 RepID=A0A1X7EIQ7_9BACT|nr:ABC transporter ATP-binding protein [Desulfovibrio gilichinskyi]SMF34672.1 lipopolysaccharide transport system ATP-binding protein [Desulfovibrio gilichinskyi]
MTHDTILTLQNVGCQYSVRKGFLKVGLYTALKDVSFEIRRGETIGVIGRNGAGKSTLLRLVAGVILPDSGVIVRHEPVSISLLTLQLGFSAELSGRDNAVLSAMLLGHRYKEAKASLDEINEFAELGGWFDEPLKTYSSGMRARLGFAVAMMMSPDVLLIDEVLGVGDESFRIKSTKVMKEKMLSGQTVLFVSHNAATIRELCSSVVWIENGVTQMVGETEEVLSTYFESLKK